MGSEPLFFYLIVFTKNTIFKNQDFRLNVTHFGHSMITPKLCESLHQNLWMSMDFFTFFIDLLRLYVYSA